MITGARATTISFTILPSMLSPSLIRRAARGSLQKCKNTPHIDHGVPRGVLPPAVDLNGPSNHLVEQGDLAGSTPRLGSTTQLEQDTREISEANTTMRNRKHVILIYITWQR